MTRSADRSDAVHRAVTALKEAALALGEVLDGVEPDALDAPRDVDELISEIIGIEVRQDEAADQ